LDAYVNEDNFTVWNSINSCLGKLNLLFSHTDYQPLFHEYGRQLLAKIHSKLGWDPVRGESHLDTLLRSLVITRLASFGDPPVIEESKKRFEAHCNGTALIPADLRSAIYRAVASSADEKTFAALFNLYRETDLQEEKDRVSRALGAVVDPELVGQVLKFAISKEVRNQDTVFVIISVAMTKPGREQAWEFFQQNKDELRQRYDGGYMVARLVKYLTENFASEEKAQEVESFFASNPFPGTERTVRQSLETIRLNSEWLSRDEANLKAYITKRTAV
jgi:puromycin-sensitive aminopeptidase